MQSLFFFLKIHSSIASGYPHLFGAHLHTRSYILVADKVRGEGGLHSAEPFFVKQSSIAFSHQLRVLDLKITRVKSVKRGERRRHTNPRHLKKKLKSIIIIATRIQKT